MDKEHIYGSEISVNFRNKTDTDFSDSPPRDHIKESNSSNETSGSSSTSRDSSISPPRESEYRKYGNFNSQKKFNFPPPPLLDKQNFPSLLQSYNSEEFQLKKVSKTESLPVITKMEAMKDKLFHLDWSNSKTPSPANSKYNDQSAFSPFQKDKDVGMVAKYSQRNVGRVSPFVMQEYDKSGRNFSALPLNDPSSIRRSLSRPESSTSIYPLYSNNYSAMGPNVSLGFPDIQRISDPVLYSSHWNGSFLNDQVIQRTNQISSLESSTPVELYVSNLDSTFEVNEMKKILLSVFREHVMVLHISMSLQPDGSAKATVKVPSVQDAQYAISRLHRRKIGHKRILISHVASDKNPPFQVLKSETVALLSDIPTKSLPLIKFRELYEKRYHRPIAVSELYKMRDAVVIQGDSGSRFVCLNTEYCKTPSIPDSEDSQESNTIERPYCERHFHPSTSQGWAEQYSVCPLPLVYISLKALATAVHTLLDTHQGSLPLISFCDCYEAEIGPLPVVGSFDCASPKEESSSSNASDSVINGKGTYKGVPLEHLIACVTGVEVAKSVLCIKKVQWLENKTDMHNLQNVNPALAGQLTLFGREVMDLLKSQPQCLVPFNKFIPTYHHHFGRQCRVADYGFTKLIDLLDSIPHIAQVLGEGQNRQVTLTHRTQVKRFAAELLRILKSRASKQIAISEFAQAYEQVIEKQFEITNYGVCEIEDMLDEVPENVIVTSSSGNEIVIGIPRREQTPEEIERTKQFAEEVIELMKHTPNCSMAFNKFIPSYHHHFGKQCRVADYGFTKLIELFEAIPNVLEVTGTGEDKVLTLVENEQHKILTERLVSVLKAQPNGAVDINQLSSAYAQMHGHALRPADFGFEDLKELLQKFSSTLRIFDACGWTFVSLIDHGVIHQISLKLRRLLMEQCDGKLPMKEVNKMYQNRFGETVNLALYFQDLTDVVTVSESMLELNPLQLLARDIIIMLQEHDNHMPLSTFGSMFQQRFGVSICTANYGFPNTYAMLDSLSDFFTVKGRKQKRIVCLNTETSDLPLLTTSLKKISYSTEDVKAKYNELYNKERSENLMAFETLLERGAANTEASKSGTSEFKLFASQQQNALTIPYEENHVSTEVFHSKYHSSTHGSVSKLSMLPSACYANPQSYSFVKIQDANVSQLYPASHQHIAVIGSTDIFQSTSTQDGLEIHKTNVAPLGVKSQCEETCFGFNSSKSTSFKAKIDSHSVEDLTMCSPQPNPKDNFPSTKSTPTRASRQSNRRNRIAAQFSSPID